MGCSASEIGMAAGIHVELTIDGGQTGAMPGLARPIVVESASLSPEKEAQLKLLVEAALAENDARRRTSTKPRPRHVGGDKQRYRLAIRRDGSVSEQHAVDEEVPPAFDSLKEFVRSNGHR